VGPKGRVKLGPKLYRPFRIMERIDTVAYMLQLPESAKLHDVFHGDDKFAANSPWACQSGASRGRQVLPRARLLGTTGPLKGAVSHRHTWMDLDEFHRLYPSFQLEDELHVQGGEMSCGGHPRTNERRQPTRKGSRATTQGRRKLIVGRNITFHLNSQ
jgi:hypothetical protein